MQFFTHETLTGSVALKTTRELRISVSLDAQAVGNISAPKWLEENILLS